jgi:AraC-like DNA-binding protein
MSVFAVLAPPAVLQLAPPYDRFEPVPDLAALTPDDLPNAAVLAVGLSPPYDAWREAAALVRELRARFPASPVVVRAEGRSEADDDMRRMAAEAGARGAIGEGDTGPALRRILTDASALPEQVLAWLSLRVPSLRTDVREMVGVIVERSPRFGEVGPLLGSMGRAERTARTWFRRAGLPGPGKWLAVAHAVRAALRLQAEEKSPLLTLAVECGYSDHSSLSRQSLRLFGARPGVIRRTLGWEWLMHRWLTRAAV